MHQDLINALTIIGAISPVGRLKIETKLRDLSQQEQLQIVALIKSADNLAYFWQGNWVQAARAWLLVRVVEWISLGSFVPPNDQTQMIGWVGQLRTMAETVVRQQLLELVTGRATLDALALAQCNLDRQSWQPKVAFTEPLKHNDNKFCYLVHAMRPSTGLIAPTRDTLKMHEYTVKKLGRFIEKGSDGTLTLKSAELYLTTPSTIEAEMLSCSLICENRKKLYGNFSFGFILQAPSTNICIASPSDLAISNSQARAAVLAMQPTPLHRLVQVDAFLESLLGLYQQPLKSPSQILALSSPTGHNEVVVLGFAGKERVKIAGIFIKVTSKNMLWQSFVNDDAAHCLRGMILTCADMCGVPIVPIQDDNDKCPGSEICFHEWLEGRKASPRPGSSPSIQATPSLSTAGSSSLVLGDTVSVYRDRDLIREYDMIAIRQDARMYLQQGMTPEQVHRHLHDQGGLPHQVVERVLESLGHRNYM
ncbi:hypothetical protein AB4Y40_23975 [Paraburkholderia sp. EG287B]|uniref:hypothetical protein n=1 Tax=Paraburkholderia sp. EG287B TaxID=3237010 RepID=UPI0034D322F6